MMEALFLAAALNAKTLPYPCQSATQVKGGLHAEVMYKTPKGEPKAKARSGWLCSGKQVAVFGFEFADDQAAQQAGRLISAQLWGGTAPTQDNTNLILKKENKIIVVSGQGHGRGTVASKLKEQNFHDWVPTASGSPEGDVLAKLAAEVHCDFGSADNLRYWCAAGSVRISVCEAV